jgi:PAS domain-containing protein
LDAGWIFFYLLWGAAALHPSMRELSEVEPDRQPRLTWPRLAMLAGASLTAPALELAKVIPTHNADLLFVIGASVILFLLVVGRMTGLVREREKSVGRERALSAAGGLLVAATEAREILIAALQALADLGKDRVDARVCRVLGDRVRVMALDGNGGLSEWEVSSGLAPFIKDSEASVASTMPDSALQGLKLAPGNDHVLQLQLRPAGVAEAGLMLIVAGEGGPDEETRYALRTLAHQVSLALSSAEFAEEVHRRASETRFATLVQNSNDLITVLSADNTILYQSPSTSACSGTPPRRSLAARSTCCCTQRSKAGCCGDSPTALVPAAGPR